MQPFTIMQSEPKSSPGASRPRCCRDVLTARTPDPTDVDLWGAAFKAAWRACTNDTAVRHLDVDAPLLMDGLAAQEASGLWSAKTVQCSTGVCPTCVG